MKENSYEMRKLDEKEVAYKWVLRNKDDVKLRYGVHRIEHGDRGAYSVWMHPYCIDREGNEVFEDASNQEYYLLEKGVE